MNSSTKIIIINILAVLVGLFVGGFVNMSIINVSGSLIPPPNGVDVTTMEGLQKAIQLFEPKHFLMPFLAHAIGTLVGAFITAFIAKKHKKRLAIFIGVFFLLGGIANVAMLPSPIWFAVVDLSLAYLPMGYLGYKLTTLFGTKNG